MVARTTLDPTMDLSFLNEKEAYLSSIPTLYQTDEVLGNRTSASKILEEEGIGSPQDIIKSLGVTSAKDILEQDRLQTEALLKKEAVKPPTTPTTTPTIPQPEVPKLQPPTELSNEEFIKLSKAERSKYMLDKTEYQVQSIREETERKRKEREDARIKEQEALLQERKNYETSILTGIENKLTAFAADPANVERANKKYSPFWIEQAKNYSGEMAGEPDEWVYASTDPLERLFYTTLSNEEKRVLNPIKQQEFEYKQQEKKYIEEFAKKLNNTYNINTVESPKLGTINFTNVSGVASGELSRSGAPYGTSRTTYKYDLEIGDVFKQGYVFLPESTVLNGANGPDGYHYNTAFLDTNVWNELVNKSQPIDLSQIGQGVKVGDVSLGRGFLFKQGDWSNFESNLEGKWRLNAFDNSPYYPDGKAIQGIANVNGELVYVREAGYKVGKDNVHTVLLYKNGSGYASYRTEPKDYGGVRGLAQDFSQAFASIPFAPEFIGIATGNPALYASLKAVQTAGSGGDVGDVFKSFAVSYASATVATNIGSYGQALGTNISAATNIPAGAANFMGGAIVGAATQGTIAAIAGQDVNKAMLAGAIGGGASASASDFTNSVFGGEAKVADLAKSVNLSSKQFSQIVTGSIANGAIAAAVYDKDFVDAFAQSLVTQGLSTSAANTVAKSLGDSVSPAQRKIIAQNTALFVRTTTYAAINKVDMQDAIKAVAPKAITETLAQGLREATKEEKK
jgi:hypothetical protein